MNVEINNFVTTDQLIQPEGDVFFGEADDKPSIFHDDLTSFHQESADPVLLHSLRVRKQKRPFSPDTASTSSRHLLHTKDCKLKKKWNQTRNDKASFCCDRCGSHYILKPELVRDKKRLKKAVPRHKVDPVSNKLLTLCNACGLAMNRQPKVRRKQDAPGSAEKEHYLLEAAAFAATVAEQLREPDAEKIFCPAFKVKACGCVQRFITGGDGGFPSDGSIRRAHDLLRLHQEAKQLKSKISTERNEKGDKRVLRMMRAEGFERFILANRLLVRQEMGICERACQRLLFYSNNFLHKDLKTGPEKGPRIKRLGGKKLSRKTLKPICELPREVCCPDRCVRLALTHNKALESWRKSALTNQHGVRKVVQEMLASKYIQTNCHKFITMVTGCSFSVIYKVKEQMRTKGQLNSEHGMRKWWRENPKKNKKTLPQNDEPVPLNLDEPSIGSLHIPEVGNNSAAMQQNMTLLHHNTQELHKPESVQPPEIQFHLEQPTFSQFIQTLSAVRPSQVVSAEAPPQSQTLTVLGPANASSSSYITPQLQFVDHSHPSVLISVPESLPGQSISLLTSNGLESLSSTPFGNVVILPESTFFMPGPQMAERVELSGQITVANGIIETL